MVRDGEKREKGGGGEVTMEEGREERMDKGKTAHNGRSGSILRQELPHSVEPCKRNSPFPAFNEHCSPSEMLIKTGIGDNSSRAFQRGLLLLLVGRLA